MVAEAFGGRRAERRPVHRRAGRHRIGARARRREGVGPRVPGDADQALGLAIERLELVVGEGPVDEGGVVDGSVFAEQPEVVLPETRQLAVGVHAPAADGRRQVVDVADEDSVAVGLAAAEGAGFEEGVGPEEVADGELQLVVGVVRLAVRWVVEIEQMVAPLLEDDNRPAGGREDVGDGTAAGARADDDGVGAYGPLTSSSV